MCELGIFTNLNRANVFGHSTTIYIHLKCVNRVFSVIWVGKICLDTVQQFPLAKMCKSVIFTLSSQKDVFGYKSTCLKYVNCVFAQFWVGKMCLEVQKCLNWVISPFRVGPICESGHFSGPSRTNVFRHSTTISICLKCLNWDCSMSEIGISNGVNWVFSLFLSQKLTFVAI